MILIHSTVSTRMILIHSNVSKFFKKQHKVYCFANRRSLDESSNSMDEKFFPKKIEVRRFFGRLLTLTTIKGQSKEWVNINRLNRYGIWYQIPDTISLILTREIFAKTNFYDINFDADLFLQIAKSRFFACIYFHSWRNLFLKLWFFGKNKKI